MDVDADNYDRLIAIEIAAKRVVELGDSDLLRGIEKHLNDESWGADEFTKAMRILAARCK